MKTSSNIVRLIYIFFILVFAIVIMSRSLLNMFEHGKVHVFGKVSTKYVRVFGESNDELKESVLNTLIRAGANGVPTLLRALDSQDPGPQLYALRGLEKIDGAAWDAVLEKKLSVQSRLEQLAVSKNGQVRSMAETIMKRLIFERSAFLQSHLIALSLSHLVEVQRPGAA